MANKLFHAAEHSNSMLPGGALDMIGRPANGGSQGDFVIVARNKAEASRIAQPVLGSGWSSRKLAVAYQGARDVEALIEAKLIDLDNLGEIIGWRNAPGGVGIVRWAADAAGREDFEVIGQWVWSDAHRRAMPVHVDQLPPADDQVRAALGVLRDWRGRGHLANPELTRALDVVAAAARTTLKES